MKRERERKRKREKKKEPAAILAKVVEDGITSGSTSRTFCWVAVQEGADLFLLPMSVLSLLPPGR